MIPGYKTVSMADIVYQPKAKLASGVPMPNDMVCHCPQGELRVKQPDGMEFSSPATCGPARRAFSKRP